MIEFFTKNYDARTYSCYDFVKDIWPTVSGREFKSPLTKLKRKRKICIVAMKNNLKQNHIGIMIRNVILHMNETGVRKDTIKTMEQDYKDFRYYTC